MTAGVATEDVEPIVVAGPNGLLLGIDAPFGDHRKVSLQELTVSGWAVSPKGIRGVVVTIDDEQFHAAYGFPSPFIGGDLAALPGAGRARFELRVGPDAITSGRRSVQVVAFDLDGGRAASMATVEFVSFSPPPYSDAAIQTTYADGNPAMWVETPWLEPQPEVAAPVDIHGWAFSPRGISDVAVFVDLVRLDTASGVARPDLRERFRPEQWATAGFTKQLDVDDLPPGRHDIAVVATDQAGRAVGVRGELAVVERLREPPPLDSIDPSEGITSERYVPDAHPLRLFAPEHHARYRWAAPAATGRRVLDVACGTGWGTAILAEVAAEAVGADVSPVAVEHARAHHGDRAEFVKAGIGSLPFADDSFDLVVCFETIEHVHDGPGTLAELRRVLRPDGALLLSSPNLKRSLHNNPHHVAERTPEGLVDLVASQFEQVETWLQESYATSLVAEPKLAGQSGDVETPDVSLRKLCATPAGGEAYTVVVAGARPSGLAPVAVMGDAIELRELDDQATTWRDRAQLAETQVASERELRYQCGLSQLVLMRGRAAVHEELERTRADLEAVRADASAQRAVAVRASAALEHVTRSLSWRLSAALRAAKARVRGRR